MHDAYHPTNALPSYHFHPAVACYLSWLLGRFPDFEPRSVAAPACCLSNSLVDDQQQQHPSFDLTMSLHSPPLILLSVAAVQGLELGVRFVVHRETKNVLKLARDARNIIRLKGSSRGTSCKGTYGAATYPAEKL